MVFDFTPERPVLNFGPRHHVRWRSRKFLLWPAWAYRVVAPRVRQRQLNVLQRAIMGLCRAGVPRVDSIAEHLAVHADLVALILTELRTRSYLDQHWLPTEQGTNILEDESFETEDMVAGYVFQDPWAGDLWPRFADSLDYCETDFSDSGFPTVVLGTTGKPQRQRTFTVLPRAQLSPSTPNANAVVEAVAQHRKGLPFKNTDDGDEETIGTFVASGAQISRVSFVDEEPQAVFLLTYLYVPESEVGALDWYACDPFGLGPSVRLRRRVETVMHDTPGLFGVVNQLVGATFQADYENHKRWQETIRLQAGLEIDRRLTVGFRTQIAFDQTLDLEAARQEMRSLGLDCPERKIKEVLRTGVKVLEAVFSSITVTHPLGDIWKRVYVSRIDRRTGRQHLAQQQDRSIYSATYDGAFRSLGFSSPIPEAFLNVKPGHVRSVAEYGDSWRLRPLVTATALVAQHDPTHPLARVATRHPHVISDIDEIATAGGGAGHANADSVAFQQAEELTDKVYSVVSALLELGEACSDSPRESSGGSHV